MDKKLIESQRMKTCEEIVGELWKDAKPNNEGIISFIIGGWPLQGSCLPELLASIMIKIAQLEREKDAQNENSKR